LYFVLGVRALATLGSKMSFLKIPLGIAAWWKAAKSASFLSAYDNLKCPEYLNAILQVCQEILLLFPIFELLIFVLCQ
jgi:hypothetical protein